MSTPPDFPDATDKQRHWLMAMHIAFALGMIFSLFSPANPIAIVPTFVVPLAVWLFGRHDTIVRHHGYRLTIFAIFYGVVYPVIATYIVIVIMTSTDTGELNQVGSQLTENAFRVFQSGERHPVIIMGSLAYAFHEQTKGFFGTLAGASATLFLAYTTFCLIVRPIGAAQAAYQKMMADEVLPFKLKWD